MAVKKSSLGSDDLANDLPEGESKAKFEVHLENFAGPFDVLLSLISKQKMDVTHVALSSITDEFVAYVKGLPQDADQLEELSSFILIAATLLDIKAARLLPGEANFDEEDLELLEARDLLFAKLLQYKAYKDVAFMLQEKFLVGSGRHPRQVPLEEKYRLMLPELNFATDTRQVALLAAGAITAFNYRNQGVSLDHIHMRQVNVAEQGVIIAKKLKQKGHLSFAELIKDAKHPVIVIGRFLSLLELYKMNAVSFEQPKALGDLQIKWVAPASFNPEDRLQGSDFDTPVTKPNHQTSAKKGHNGKRNT